MNLTLRNSTGAGVDVNGRMFDISTFRNRYNDQNRRFKISLESFSFENPLFILNAENPAPNPVNLYVQLHGFQYENAMFVDGNNSRPDQNIAILNGYFYGPTFAYYTNSKTSVPIISTIPSSITVSFQTYVDGVLRPMVIEDNIYVLKLRLDPIDE